MPHARNGDQLRIRERSGHLTGDLRVEQVAEFAAQDQQRKSRQSLVKRPDRGRGLIGGGGEVAGDGHVIIEHDAPIAFDRHALRETQPLRRVISRIDIGVLGGERGGHCVPVGKFSRATDIGLDPVDPALVNLGSDIVEHCARDPVVGLCAKQHRHDPAERSAQNNRAVDAQLVEQFDHVRSVGHGQIAFGLRVMIAEAASAKIERKQAPLARESIRDRFEIARVAGQPGQADDRRAIGGAVMVTVMEPQAVAARIISVSPCCHPQFPLRLASPIAAQ